MTETKRNMPTPEGRELGRMLAKLTDLAEPSVRARFPNHGKRCKSCAFTAGTFPNGCPETLIDALACLIRDEPFYCHQRFNADGTPVDLCAGWLIALEAATELPAPIKAVVMKAKAELEAARAKSGEVQS